MKRFKKIVMFIFVVIITLVITACDSQTPRDSFNTYIKAWEDKDYETMYSMISKESREYIKKEDFINRYSNIYTGIGAENIKIDVKEGEGEKTNIYFRVSMDTLAGEISLDSYEVDMIKEKVDEKSKWKIQWNESMIFPEMTKEDKVKVNILEGKRGQIFDKYGNGLAINGKRYSLGIYPKLYDTANTKRFAKLLDIDEKTINDKLGKNKNPEHFIPIVKLALDDKEKLNKALEIQGIKHYNVTDRIYPGGEALGSLTGYIKPITAEQLEKDEDGIYHNTSLVGKAGLETVYEKTLRAKDGKEIYISKMDKGKEVDRILLVREEAQDGEDINLTIDTELQKKIYNEMNGDTGAAIALHPKTGEILSMVSSPSYDPNLYTTYISNTQRKQWEDMKTDVFENKFNGAYSPGSTFKVVTASIGLETGTIDPVKKVNIQGKSWQKDSSWGNYKINRVSQKLSSVNLNDAFIYSDNIYFARAALKIGGERFLNESRKFGFGEELPINYPFAKSQIINGEKITSEILLSDTGYGQGEVLMSPLHLSLVYSMFVNGGNIMEAVLEKDKDPKVWKSDIISDKNRKIVLNSLIDVIEDKNGTGYEAKLSKIKLAGKTGTAELKLSQKDEGQENGWFVAMNVDKPEIVISMIIENVEDRGGSHHVVPKVKNIIKDYLKNK